MSGSGPVSASSLVGTLGVVRVGVPVGAPVSAPVGTLIDTPVGAPVGAPGGVTTGTRGTSLALGAATGEVASVARPARMVSSDVSWP